MRLFIIQWTLLLILMATTAAQDRMILCPRVQSTDMSKLLDAVDPNGPGLRYNEISGLVFSPTLKSPRSGEPLFYGVNDADGTRIGVWDSATGERLRTFHISSSSLPFGIRDRESMTAGSCGVGGEEGEHCIYIADVGDNTARGSNGGRTGRADVPYRIIKIKEPNIDEFADNETIPESYISVLNYNYMHPTSPSEYADCEAVFLDNVGWGEDEAQGDIYFIPKWGVEDNNEKNRLFKIPASVWLEAADSYTYSPVAAEFYDNGNAFQGKKWTRAEMTLDGSLIAVGDYFDQYLFLRCPGMSVKQALTGQGVTPCEQWPVRYDQDSQFETIAWTPNGEKTLEISEGRNAPMAWTTFDYTYDPESSVVCPALLRGTSDPTQAPSDPPTSALPTLPPSKLPSTNSPSLVPSTGSSFSPSVVPSIGPSVAPSFDRSASPTQLPSQAPSGSSSSTNPESLLLSTLAPAVSSETRGTEIDKLVASFLLLVVVWW